MAGDSVTQKHGGAARRRDRILDAGQELFLSHGLTGTTMEAIARQAGVAKPTLYGYFPDKEAVYGAALARLFETLREAVESALDEPGTPAERVAGALVAKFKGVFRVLEGSPHAAELLAAKSKHAAGEMEALDRWMADRLAGVLAEAGTAEPHKYAELLIACGDGIMHRARHAEQIGPAIRLVTAKVLAG